MARALLGQPEIIFLDEPSAHLDAESEKILVDTLKQISKSCLVIVVAHRPAFIEHADAVFELKNGELQNTRTLV